MSSNCDPLALTYVAGGFTIVGGVIGVYIGHILTKSRDSINARTATIDKWMDIFSGEIQRIESEKYSSTQSIGDISTIKTLIAEINIISPEISLSREWEQYKGNEYRRKYQEPDKKNNAINALKNIIHIINSSKK